MIYILTFLISGWLLWLGDRTKGTGHFVLVILGLFLPILLAGLRDLDIGTDTSGYPIDVFDFCQSTDSLLLAIVSYLDVESGYVALAWICSQISNSFNFFLVVTHSIILVTLLFAYRKFNINVALAYLFIFLIYFSSSMNTARQFLAMPFCLFSLAELIQKQYKKALLLFLIAFLFHRSSFFFLTIFCLYYLCSNHFNKMRQKKVFLGVTILVVVGLTMFVELLQFAINIGIARVEYMDRYGSEDKYGASLPVSLLAINCFNYILYHILTRRIEITPFLLFSKYIMLACVILCFAGLISTFAVRLDHYFMITGIVCTVYALKIRKYLYFWIYLAFYSFYWYMVVVVANLSDTFPYHSLILGI